MFSLPQIFEKVSRVKNNTCKKCLTGIHLLSMSPSILFICLMCHLKMAFRSFKGSSASLFFGFCGWRGPWTLSLASQIWKVWYSLWSMYLGRRYFLRSFRGISSWHLERMEWCFWLCLLLLWRIPYNHNVYHFLFFTNKTYSKQTNNQIIMITFWHYSLTYVCLLPSFFSFLFFFFSLLWA
jgi:hypothetical protein